LIGRVKASPVLDELKISMSGDDPRVSQNVLGVWREGRINVWFGLEIKNKDSYTFSHGVTAPCESLLTGFTAGLF
jgi:hypothetical protein